MAEEAQNGEAQKQGAWEKFRGFVKANKGKIIGVFTAIVAYLAGDGTISSFVQAVWNAIFGA